MKKRQDKHRQEVHRLELLREFKQCAHRHHTNWLDKRFYFDRKCRKFRSANRAISYRIAPYGSLPF